MKRRAALAQCHKWLASAALLLAWGGSAPTGTARADSPPTPLLKRVWTDLAAGNTFTSDGVWLHDPYAAHTVELEWMLVGPISMGLRGLPMLVYFDRESVVGGGLGISNRVYLTRNASGLYFGPAVAVVVHYGRFDRNSSNINFLSSVELGYQFAKAPYRFGFKVEHVSNANLATYNRGWNGISLFFGTILWTNTP